MRTYDTITLTYEGPLARLTLSRPDAMNALGPQTLDDLLGAIEELHAREDVHVVLLAGEGRAFSVGFDLRAMAGLLGAGAMPPEELLREAAGTGYRVIAGLAGLPQVTVASVHGHAVGGGLLLAAACDLRIAADGTRFSLPEVDIGLPLIWGGVPLLCHVLGTSLTRDLVLTCNRLSAESFDGHGFLRERVPAASLAEATERLTEGLLAKPAPALRLTKAQLSAIDRTARGDTLEQDGRAFSDAIMHPGFLPAAMTYLQKLRRGTST